MLGIAFNLTEHCIGILLFYLCLCGDTPSVLHCTSTTESALSSGVDTRSVLIYTNGGATRLMRMLMLLLRLILEVK